MKTVSTTVFKMVRLRHVHIFMYRLFARENAKELHEESSKFHNLRTLSTPCFSCIEDVELMLTKTPNLLELKCHFTSNCSHQSRLLVFPIKLETLYISGEKPIAHIPVFISASNLKRLTVYHFELDHEDLSHIGHELQNLQALEMVEVSFQERKWEVSDTEFPQLKVLKLRDCFSFKDWTVSDDAFPNLERLVLHECNILKDIPSCFADISTLKYVEVMKCSKSVEKSARDIRETRVEDYQDADFELFINPLLPRHMILSKLLSKVALSLQQK